MAAVAHTGVSDGPTEGRSVVHGGPFEVRTEVFEGPFDLLLHLILRDEVDLYEVVVGDIVDAYLAELDHMEQLDLEVATEFLLIAATLVQLKSSRLLPDSASVDLDEELALWSERDLLLARLLECHTFKVASAALEQLAAAAGRGFSRNAGPDDRYADLVPDFLAGIGPDDLRAAFLRATVARPEPKVSLAHVTDIPVTVNEVATELAARLPAMGTVGFRELTGHLSTGIEVVVYFLAVLELYKRGLVEVSQAATFGRIAIAWSGDDDIAAPFAEIDAYEG
ncbi:segregation and condensation protein A [Candidatus Poriferisocius sp.]|uniref:segregation and condensation protein A n=1 Tax=Candidatus Poriferisocius sp. TaxID=3101276 RepID=UPI003B015C2E